MRDESATRRTFLQATALGVTGLASGCIPEATNQLVLGPPPSRALLDTGAPACAFTMAAGSGPYYRAGAPRRTNFDRYGDAGDPVVLTGTVTNSDCDPLRVILDIWHADPDGVYDNKTAQYRYRGRIFTPADGTFTLYTLKPAWYPAGARIRAPHIHYSVVKGGATIFTSEVYFDGDKHNASDLLWDPALTIAFTDDGTGTLEGHLDIVV
jgi:protocatechuate 3,4-dioxygenase beta subunit